MALERRDRVVQPSRRANQSREEHDDKAKPFEIPKREIWEAFKKVRANQGAAGIDGQTIEAFEADLASSLYKLWNRMSFWKSLAISRTRRAKGSRLINISVDVW